MHIFAEPKQFNQIPLNLVMSPGKMDEGKHKCKGEEIKKERVRNRITGKKPSLAPISNPVIGKDIDPNSGRAFRSLLLF